MTVIAVRGRAMAADKQTTFGNTRVRTTKIRRLSDGRIAGAAGATWKCKAIMDWIEAARPTSEYPDPKGEDCVMVVLDLDGSIWLYDGPTPFLIEADFHAIGAGQDLALAAMHLGQDARGAVEVASIYSSLCGGGIDVLELDAAA